jgi:hypothetical protein
MKESQIAHIGMVNSFNVITNRNTVDEIVSAGIGIFAHSPEQSKGLESIKFMIFYFQELEMFERCSELKQYIEKTFNEDGTYKDPSCDCEYPEIEKYTPEVKCSICNMRIKR